MCFQKKTIINKTGLGEEQYDALSTNQGNMGTQIEEGFVATGGKLDTISSNVDQFGRNIYDAASLVNTNTNTGFTNLTDLLGTYNQGMNDQFSNAAISMDHNAGLLSKNNTALRKLPSTISTGFTEMDARFDTVDDVTGDTNSTLDQGIDAMDAGFTQAQANRDQQAIDAKRLRDSGFEAATTEFNKGFEGASKQLTETQANVLGGQDNLGATLDTMQGSADIYAGQSLENQAALQKKQDGFVSSFDTYVDRYSDDTTLANQTRADLQLAQNNAAKALRTDIGNYAQAAAQGQDNINRNIGTLGEGSARGFEVLADTVQGGFSDTTAANQLESQNLSSRIGNVKSLLQTTGETIDATSREQYTALANSFDENGQLIANSVDAQGNTISRAMDDQGRIIETKFDGAGSEISKVQMDVETMLSNAEQYQSSLTGQISGLQEVTEGGFTGVDSALGTGFADTENSIVQGLQSQGANINNLFDTQGGVLQSQGADLLNVLSNQQGLDATLRNQATSISAAFSDTGQLIANTQDDLGNTITNSIDEQGNLITQKFDQTGRLIQDTSVNINEVLSSGLTNTSGQISDVQSALRNGFDTQSGTLSQQAKQILGVAQNIEQFDGDSRSQFADIASAFDDQGNLIQNSTDSLGNNILRQLDANGNLITQRLDQNGTVLETSNSNVSDALTAIQQQTGSLSDRIQLGFSDIDRGQQNLTDTVQTGQQGLMAETVNTQDMLGNTSRQLVRGFDETSGTLDIQTRDLANIASGQSDLDIRMRQDFKQVSNAFDDQGLLITNTVADNGTTISRAVDQNGNLLLRAFDAQGNRIGDKVLNINRTLFDLQNLQTQAGGNVSMGNLSAPMQGEIPTSGFASPFTTTR